MKKALITGITGQDGTYLAELLLEKGYEVHGIKRRASLFNTQRIDHLYQDPHDDNQRFVLHFGDLTDSTNIIRVIQEVQPDEIYNLGAMSHVHVSFEMPEYTSNADATGTLRVLEAIRLLGMAKKVKFYQASTSELYGKVQSMPQNENTPFYPRSPYAVAKLYAYWITVNYREAYDMFACNGILFNHESPLRGENFITRKITRGTAKILLGLKNQLYLGNLDAKRDWGHAKDYALAMWLMLQQDIPQDYVVATGITTTVRDFVKMAFAFGGIELAFSGQHDQEIATVVKCTGEYQLPIGKQVLSIDPRYYRPTEVDILQGDATKAKTELGWEPKYTLKEMAEEMMIADIKLMRLQKMLKDEGYLKQIS